MSLDIIEIALDRFTDAALFEKLATEIMRDEGFHNIVRLGGSHDYGMDASQDVFYNNGDTTRIVFQYTLEDYVVGKLRDTIEKLRANGISFGEIVIVTTTALTTQRHENVRKVARTEFNVSATCYSRDTLVNRLADNTNGLFERFFPSIDAQLAALRQASPIIGDPNGTREAALLATALAFVHSPEGQRARRSLFDHLVLASLFSAATPVKVSHTRASICESLRTNSLTDEQIAASIARLQSRGLVESTGADTYRIAAGATNSLLGTRIRVDHERDSLISDIVETVCSAGGQVRPQERTVLKRNALAVLNELLRMHSMELSTAAESLNTDSRLQIGPLESLRDIARRNTSAPLGDLLLAAVAQVLHHPNTGQATTLARLARAYLAVATMNFDPVLRELQVTRIKEKQLILDTDVALTCLVKELPLNVAYKAVVHGISQLGVTVHLPEEIIEECAAHAGRAHRTYNYHGESLFGLSQDIVDTHVRNVFVRGYYHKYVTATPAQRRSFEAYMDNYYASQEPVRFMREVAVTTFGEDVRLATIDSLAPGTHDESLAIKAREVMLELIESTPFVDTRTQDEKRRLADTDARLLLTLCRINGDLLQDETKQLMWARGYVLTNSSRYQKAARRLQVVNVATTRPPQVASVYEMLRGQVIDDVMFVQLLSNPVVNAVVDAMWPELQGIAKSGIELRDKSLVRLRRDVDATFHDALSSAEEAEAAADETGDDVSESAADERYIALLDKAAALGYQLSPIAARVQQISKASADKDRRIAELENQFREIDEQISHFGRRKQRYLRKMAAKRPD